MNPVQKLMSAGRDGARTVHERTVDKALEVGLLDDVETLSVGGVTADYRVTRQKERWRARSAMGERPIFELLADELGPEDTFWDVGAAVGTYAVFAGAAGSEVVAFEPEAANVARLRENAILNNLAGRIHTYKVALSDRDGSALLYSDGDVGDGGHRLTTDRDRGDQVDTIPGDEITPAPTVVKIDVEGHELKVLDGMVSHLRSTRLVIVEVHAGISLEDIRSRLEPLGFTLENATGGRESTLGGESDEFHVLARR